MFKFNAKRRLAEIKKARNLLFITCCVVSGCFVFTFVPSIFQNAKVFNITVRKSLDTEEPFDPELVALAQNTFDKYYTNTFSCKLLFRRIRCLVGRDRIYIYPYECSLPYTPPDIEPIVFPFFVPHFSPLFLPFPYSAAVYYSSPSNILRSSENDAQTLVCPCNCRIKCKPPARKLYLNTGKTYCNDCKCLYRDLGCDCLDDHDLYLMTKPTQDFIRFHSRFSSVFSGDDDFDFINRTHVTFSLWNNLTNFK